LIDLTLTVGVLGLLSAVAVPKFFDSLDYHRAKTAAAQVQADLALARQLAMARSEPLAVQFSAASDKYTLEGVDHPDRVGQTYTVLLGGSPHEADLTSASLGGDERLVFNAFGLPDSGGTIAVQSGRWRRTVTIDPETGKAAMP
jgi:hypothetical protein